MPTWPLPSGLDGSEVVHSVGSSPKPAAGNEPCYRDHRPGWKTQQVPRGHGTGGRKLVSQTRWTISCWGQTSLPSAQHVLELVAWMQPQGPRSVAHTPRRRRATCGEATGSMSFGFWKNEKCPFRSDHSSGASGCEAVPPRQVACVYSGPRRQSHGRTWRQGNSWESLEAEEEK